jgi:N-acyl amino acid synthase of PEP-CTERM/exosortase system
MLVDHFDQYFELLPVKDAAARAAVHRLRYAVYCEELRYEDPSAFPDGQERDSHDDGALYALLRHRASDRPVACVRLLVDHDQRGRPFPFEQVCAGRLDPAEIDLRTLDRSRCGEISRLAIHQDFRRRRGEWQTPEAVGDPDAQTGGQRRYPLLPMSLFLAAAALAMNRGLVQVFVMMEPRLARLLASCGIHFTAVGEVIDYHGLRGPFRITHAALEQGLPPDGRALLDAMRQRLR